MSSKMKTFSEFISEGQHFLRSIGKNDHVADEMPIKSMRPGDTFYSIWFNQRHNNIQNIEKHELTRLKQSSDGQELLLYYMSENGRDEYEVSLDFASVSKNDTSYRERVKGSLGTEKFITTSREEAMQFANSIDADSKYIRNLDESQHFLRSIGRNDAVKDYKTFRDLKDGDHLFIVYHNYKPKENYAVGITRDAIKTLTTGGELDDEVDESRLMYSYKYFKEKRNVTLYADIRALADEENASVSDPLYVYESPSDFNAVYNTIREFMEKNNISYENI